MFKGLGVRVLRFRVLRDCQLICSCDVPMLQKDYWKAWWSLYTLNPKA